MYNNHKIMITFNYYCLAVQNNGINKIPELINDIYTDADVEVSKTYISGIMRRFFFVFNLAFGVLSSFLGFFISDKIDDNIQDLDDEETFFGKHQNGTRFFVNSPILKYVFICIFALLLGLIYNIKMLKKDYVFLLCYVFVLAFVCNPILGFNCEILDEDEGTKALLDFINSNDFAKVLVGIWILTAMILLTIFFEKIYLYKMYFFYFSILLFLIHIIIVISEYPILDEDLKIFKLGGEE